MNSPNGLLAFKLQQKPVKPRDHHETDFAFETNVPFYNSGRSDVDMVLDCNNFKQPPHSGLHAAGIYSTRAGTYGSWQLASTRARQRPQSPEQEKH